MQCGNCVYLRVDRVCINWGSLNPSKSGPNDFHMALVGSLFKGFSKPLLRITDYY